MVLSSPFIVLIIDFFIIKKAMTASAKPPRQIAAMQCSLPAVLPKILIKLLYKSS